MASSGNRRGMGQQRIIATILAHSRLAVAVGLTALLPACSVYDGLVGTPAPQLGTPGFVSGFLGGVVSDEPRATLAGREVLSAGGNAADAAVAVGFTLAVTLPSRAGIGGGGACLAFAATAKSINQGTPEAILFLPSAPPSPGARSDRPAALPLMARGMFLLHSRYGSRPIETFLGAVEEGARFGVPVSRALARDLSIVAGPLSADPTSREVFLRSGGPLTEGEMLLQPELSTTISQMRVSGIGDLYQGGLARRVEAASSRIGGPLSLADLRTALPRLTTPLVLSYRNDMIAFLPPPADGGLAAAAAFKTLQQNPGDWNGAEARAAGTASVWRRGDGTSVDQLLAAPVVQDYPLPPLPASTSFATLDLNGNAVVCVLTMNNLFGTGRMMPGLGFLAAASPAYGPAPLLSAALAWNDNTKAFRAAVGGTGQAGAPVAAAGAMMNTLVSQQPMPSQVPDPGRANVIACGRYLPRETASCGWAADPREFGLAAGGG